MGDSLQAMSWYKNSISLNPLNDTDIFGLAEILLKKANFDGAKLMLNKCMELDPVNPDYRITYARLLYETQDDQAAIGYLLSLLDEFGENPKVLSEIAIFYFRSGRQKDFQDYKTKLEKNHSLDKAFYEFLIKAALLDERTNEIPELVEKLLVIEPGELEQMMIAGKVLFESGKLVDAEKWFKRVQAKLSSYPKVLYYIAKIDFLRKDIDGAMEKIKQDIKENGENDDDLVFMAQMLQVKKENIEAEILFKKAQKLNPNSYDAIIGLADLSTERSNHDLALDLYKRAMKLRPDEPAVYKKIGDLYRRIGQGALAIESYKMYLEMEPESSHKNNLEAYINDNR
jgi:tetratricopeptide (TPR) repeat protein